MTLLFALAPQTVTVLKFYGFTFGAVAVFVVLFVLFQSLSANLARLNRVRVLIWESDGTITPKLVKPFFKGEHHVTEIDGEVYILDANARYQMSYPGNSLPVIGPLLNNNIAVYCFRRGVGNPMMAAPITRKQPVLSSLSLRGFMNHSFMFEGTKFVDWYEKASATIAQHPRAVMIVSVIILIGVAALIIANVVSYMSLNEIHQAVVGVTQRALK